MGKVKEAFTDDGAGLAEWVYRKLRNHDPLSARDKAKGLRSAFVTKDPLVVRYATADGRCFEVAVRQVPPNELIKEKVVA